ncbi:alpha/beta-hydrolase [Ramicandelaber brevisporus]|nr:alpha/beta-hydrolase [Ramicandelaber brevisporus]
MPSPKSSGSPTPEPNGSSWLKRPLSPLAKPVKDEQFDQYIRTWAVAPEPPKAAVVIVHGFGEHCDRYAELAESFTAAGIHAHSFDQRGFGRTGRRNKSMPLGHSGGWHNIEADLQAAIDRTREAVPAGTPLFLFGHSMGGCIAANFVADHGAKSNLKGVILSSPLMRTAKKSAPPGFLVTIGKVAGKLFTTLPMSSDIKAEYLSHDKDVVREFEESFYNYNVMTLSSAADLFTRSEALLESKYDTHKLPTLVVHGENDDGTCPDASKEYFDKLTVEDKQYKLYPKMYHELHNEPEVKQELFALYNKWILDRAISN